MAGDVDGDGRAELICLRVGGGVVVLSLLENPPRVSRVAGIESTPPGGAAVGLLGRDSFPSLIIGGKVYQLRNGLFEETGSFPGGGSVKLADMDGDGSVDIVAVGHGAIGSQAVPGEISVYSRAGGVFNKIDGVTLSPIAGCSIVDANSDQRPDVVYIPAYGSSEATVLLNSPSGLSSGQPLVDVGSHRELNIMDFDDDGALDVLAHWPVPSLTIDGDGLIFEPFAIHWGASLGHFATPVALQETAGAELVSLVGSGRFTHGAGPTSVAVHTADEIRIFSPTQIGGRDYAVRNRFKTPGILTAAAGDFLGAKNGQVQTAWITEAGAVYLAQDAAPAADSTMRVSTISVRVPAPAPIAGAGYAVRRKGSEYQFLFNGQHFLTVMNTQGLVVRPRPGQDPNGWGSTPYLSPFLPGATLRGCTVSPSADGSNGIRLQASGPVYQGSAGSFGTWQLDMNFLCDLSQKRSAGRGVLSVALPSPLSQSTGDLNIARIASNVLNGVPTYGGQAQTGDMSVCHVSGSDFAPFDWWPVLQPGHFPQDRTRALTMTVAGALNDVKTAALGQCPIQIAVKPSCELVLSARDGVRMIFGGFFAASQGANPYADNIGVTPLVLRGDTQATAMVFDVELNAQALPEDGTSVEADMGVNYAPSGTAPASLDVFYSTSLTGSTAFDRIVGTLNLVSPGIYLGSVPVPRVSVGSGRVGFFRARAKCP